MDIVKGNMGWIEVVVGPMFSGKSEELIRRLRRAEFGKQRVQIFKPVIDQRYAKNGIVSQFLGDSVVDACTKLADLGKRVIVAGLDTDFMGRPFEPMPRLLAVAEEITKLLAICMRCGNPAVHTQRLVASDELIVVGAGGMYEARCRRCFEPFLAQQRIEEEREKAANAAAARAIS